MGALEDAIDRLGEKFKVDSAAYAYAVPDTVGELRALVDVLNVLKVADDAVVEDGFIYVRLDRPGTVPHFSYCANHFIAEGDQFIVGTSLHECDVDE